MGNELVERAHERTLSVYDGRERAQRTGDAMRLWIKFNSEHRRIELSCTLLIPKQKLTKSRLWGYFAVLVTHDGGGGALGNAREWQNPWNPCDSRRRLSTTSTHILPNLWTNWFRFFFFDRSFGPQHPSTQWTRKIKCMFCEIHQRNKRWAACAVVTHSFSLVQFCKCD